MKNSNLDLENLIQGFKLSCQTEGKSPKTIEWYTSFLERFYRFLRESHLPVDVADIDKDHIRSFIRYLQTEARVPRRNTRLSPATVQGYVRTLKAFFSWTAREEYLISNPMARVPVPRGPTKVVNTFTTEQIISLLDVCRRSNGNGHRNLTVQLLMLDSGVRVSELVGMEPEDVNLTEGYVTIRNGKGGKERLVPIGSLVQKSLWKYINHFRPQPLIPRVTRLFLSDAESLASIHSLAMDHGLTPTFFGIRKDTKPIQKTRDRLLVMWDFQTLGLQAYQVEEAERWIRSESKRRFPNMTIEMFKAFSHPSQSSATNKLVELGWRVWEEPSGMDEELIDQTRSDAGQDVKATILVLVTRNSEFMDLIDEMQKKGVRVYLLSPSSTDDDLIDEVGRKRWIKWDGHYFSLPILRY